MHNEFHNCVDFVDIVSDINVDISVLGFELRQAKDFVRCVATQYTPTLVGCGHPWMPTNCCCWVYAFCINTDGGDGC